MTNGISCSTLEIVHYPVLCDPIPASTINFSEEEKQNTMATVLNKFFIRSKQLQNRIIFNCDNANAHNKQYRK